MRDSCVVIREMNMNDRLNVNMPINAVNKNQPIKDNQRTNNLNLCPFIILLLSLMLHLLYNPDSLLKCNMPLNKKNI